MRDNDDAQLMSFIFLNMVICNLLSNENAGNQFFCESRYSTNCGFSKNNRLLKKKITEQSNASFDSGRTRCKSLNPCQFPIPIHNFTASASVFIIRRTFVYCKGILKIRPPFQSYGQKFPVF